MAERDATGRSTRGFSENVWVTERQLGTRVAGPFSVTDIERALVARGWTLTDTEADEVRIYRHPSESHPVLIDPSWDRVYAGDPVFRRIARDVGVANDDFAALIQQS